MANKGSPRSENTRKKQVNCGIEQGGFKFDGNVEHYLFGSPRGMVLEQGRKRS